VVALKAYETLSGNICKVQDPVHAIELGVPFTDLGDTRFGGRTIILPRLDIQLPEDIGRNGINVGGRDAMGGKKGLDWSGHLYEVQKGLGQVDPFLVVFAVSEINVRFGRVSWFLCLCSLDFLDHINELIICKSSIWSIFILKQYYHNLF